KNVDGGVMITGSHNPANHNGFKISLGKESIHGAQIQQIKEIALGGDFASGSGRIENADGSGDYQRGPLARLKMGERKLKVVTHGGTGMGGATAVPLYRALGVDLVELFTEPDSSFPNHHPDPTVTENLQDAIRAVREHNADLALAFDGDGDRIGVVNDRGEI